ncbi:platelet endothelial aggregation receptor 1-like isoform X2 [Toxorhynchites rutilus septentrionalis]|uniref:platelet endothelial aggregation receptor 1-like isoform X2 n=1 Tax=Toxorhynchites rutilus septentrionalis TaxID=329112 RepID=UPI002479A1CE|nr:platelet endothelial aggregation receptor 1-like isoform X2 [Toxorhynchites rutilus septentrionalis]
MLIKLEPQETIGVRVFGAEGSRSVLWPCTTSEDCSKVPQARCSIYGFCQCPAGHVFSTDVTRCLPEVLYGVACQEAVQCSHMLTGAKCEAGLCTCDTDYTYVRGRCRQLANLHEPCNNDIDCFFSYNREAVVCREGSCECAQGFYERSTNVCRRQVDLGEPCLVNQDCNGDNLECQQDVCKEVAQGKTFRDIGVQARPEEKTKTEERTVYDKQQQTSVSKRSSDNEHELENEIRKESSSSGATAKRVRLHSSLDSPTKDGSTPGFGDSCTEETQECAGVPYSVCMMGQCHCREGFYNVKEACKAELGEFVRSAADCGDGIFSPESRCVCRNNQFYNYNMRTCLKGALGINTSCTASSQCSPYGAAYCPQESPKRCTCYPYAVYDAQRQMCVPRKGYEEYCVKNEHCTLANTRCSEVNTCVCRPNYMYINEACMATQGGTCSSTKDCGFDKAVCEPEKDSNEKEKKCDCVKGHVYHENECLKEAEEYEDECNVNEQCQPLLGNLAKCMDGKCKCDESCTHLKDGQCHMKKALDERCSRSSECFVEDGEDTVECRNSACQCKFGYTADVERQVCVKPRGKSSSGRPSALKVITLLLTSAAVLITGSALRDAYYM